MLILTKKEKKKQKTLNILTKEIKYQNKMSSVES